MLKFSLEGNKIFEHSLCTYISLYSYCSVKSIKCTKISILYCASLYLIILCGTTTHDILKTKMKAFLLCIYNVTVFCSVANPLRGVIPLLTWCENVVNSPAAQVMLPCKAARFTKILNIYSRDPRDTSQWKPYC